MSVSDHDLEMLETWLDGELSEEQADALRRRISNDTALAQMADQLRSDRQLRAHAWQGLDSGGDIEALIANVRRANRKNELWGSRLQALRQVSGIAAAVVLMFGAGWISRSRLSTSPDSPPAAVATNINATSSTNPGQSNKQPAAPGGPVMLTSNEFRMNRGPNGQLESNPNQLNPLLAQFDTRSLSTTPPRFRVQVLDAFGNLTYEKPMDTYDDALKFANYIGNYQAPTGLPSPVPNSNIVPVNQTPR
jgi:hypothetical protein